MTGLIITHPAPKKYCITRNGEVLKVFPTVELLDVYLMDSAGELYRDCISEARHTQPGKKPGKKRILIQCVETGEVFNGAPDASEKTGVSISTVYHDINRVRPIKRPPNRLTFVRVLPE